MKEMTDCKQGLKVNTQEKMVNKLDYLANRPGSRDCTLGNLDYKLGMMDYMLVS